MKLIFSSITCIDEEVGSNRRKVECEFVLKYLLLLCPAIRFYFLCSLAEVLFLKKFVAVWFKCDLLSHVFLKAIFNYGVRVWILYITGFSVFSGSPWQNIISYSYRIYWNFLPVPRSCFVKPVRESWQSNDFRFSHIHTLNGNIVTFWKQPVILGK